MQAKAYASFRTCGASVRVLVSFVWNGRRASVKGVRGDAKDITKICQAVSTLMVFTRETVLCSAMVFTGVTGFVDVGYLFMPNPSK